VTTSKATARLALIAAFFLCSCGLDGGSRGTGITSTVLGNVVSVQMSASVWPHRDRNSAQFAHLGHFVRRLREASTAGQVEGITVTVEQSGAQGITDSAGSFSVRGKFEGRLTLLFTRPEGAIRAHTAINLPAGGTLTLNNVRIDNAHGVASADSEDVDFLGQIVQIDCAAQNLILVASRRAPSDSDSYTLRLDTSTLLDPQGNPVSCDDLRNGQTAHVQGTVNADGSFGHAVVVIE
jgi:hypothetical protein